MILDIYISVLSETPRVTVCAVYIADTPYWQRNLIVNRQSDLSRIQVHVNLDC